MKKRMRMSRSRSRKLFTKTASSVKSRNYRGAPMRGGIRL